MQQRQLRLGDIVDDYCPRERRLTNHAVVAMIEAEVKQTRCTTCDTEHVYKHARVPRQRRKSEPAALYAQVLADATPKKVVHDVPVGAVPGGPEDDETDAQPDETMAGPEAMMATAAAVDQIADEDGAPGDDDGDEPRIEAEEGPVHRTLIRAQLPRHEGQVPLSRPAPDFTIRQPTGRPHRFRPQRPGGFEGNRSQGNGHGNGYGNNRGAASPYGGRSPLSAHPAKRHGGAGRKRTK